MGTMDATDKISSITVPVQASERENSIPLLLEVNPLHPEELIDKTLEIIKTAETIKSANESTDIDKLKLYSEQLLDLKSKLEGNYYAWFHSVEEIKIEQNRIDSLLLQKWLAVLGESEKELAEYFNNVEQILRLKVLEAEALINQDTDLKVINNLLNEINTYFEPIKSFFNNSTNKNTFLYFNKLQVEAATSLKQSIETIDHKIIQIKLDSEGTLRAPKNLELPKISSTTEDNETPQSLEEVMVQIENYFSQLSLDKLKDATKPFIKLDSKVTIGRKVDDTSKFRLLNGNISREHIELTRTNDGNYELGNISAKDSPVLINGESLLLNDRKEIKSGDIISLGSERPVDRESNPTELMPTNLIYIVYNGSSNLVQLPLELKVLFERLMETSEDKYNGYVKEYMMLITILDLSFEVIESQRREAILKRENKILNDKVYEAEGPKYIPSGISKQRITTTN